MELAAFLHCPLQRLQSETTSTEFLDWVWFMNEKRKEENTVASKTDWYLAQIAFEVFNAFRKKRTRKVSDFLLKFTIQDSKKKKKTPPVTREEAAKRSKAFWFGSLGVSDKKTKTPKENSRKKSLPDKVLKATMEHKAKEK